MRDELESDHEFFSPVGVAQIGCGYWGRILHDKYLSSDNRYNVLHYGGSDLDVDEVLDDERVGMVVIATPVDTHAELVKRSLLAGKHVLSEKPIALTSQEANEIRLLGDEVGRQVITEYTQTFSRALQFLAEDGAGLGKIEAIKMRVHHAGRFYDDTQKDVYWLLASHLLSIYDMFKPLGDQSFRSQTFIRNGLVATDAMIFTENDLLEVSLNMPKKEYQVVLQGERGTAYYDAVNQPHLTSTYYERTLGVLSNELVHSTQIWKEYNEKDNLSPMFDYAWEVINGRESSNIDRAIEVTRILEELSH